MRRNTLLGLPAAAAAVALALGACTGGKTGRDDASRIMSDSIPQNTSFESYTYDVLASAPADSLLRQFPDSVGKWRLVGDGILPTKIGSHDISLLRDTLMKIAQVVYDRPGKAVPAGIDNLVVSDQKVSETPYANTNVNSLGIDLMSPYVIVWERYVYNYYWGAAHGQYATDYINYSALDNKVLSLSDLFVPGYERDLLELVRQKLVEEEIPLLVGINEVELPANFRIRGNGISLVYSLYSIAPYSEGEVKVDLSVYDLDGILTPRALEMILGPQSH